LIAASVMMIGRPRPGMSRMKAWLMRRSVRRPVSFRTWLCENGESDGRESDRIFLFSGGRILWADLWRAPIALS
jgi:hypothetical protein